jgi:hypothetical protein
MEPQTAVELEDGSTATLAELHHGEPIFLIFLRHFGCVFCRYQVAQLRNDPDLPVYFVCMETAAEARRFKSKMKSPHRFISDPSRRLYSAFGLKRAGFRQIVSLKAAKIAFRAVLNGQFQGRPTTDSQQLSGAVLLNSRREAVWTSLADDASDIFLPRVLREQLLRIGQKIA